MFLAFWRHGCVYFHVSFVPFVWNLRFLFLDTHSSFFSPHACMHVRSPRTLISSCLLLLLLSCKLASRPFSRTRSRRSSTMRACAVKRRRDSDAQSRRTKNFCSIETRCYTSHASHLTTNREPRSYLACSNSARRNSSCTLAGEYERWSPCAASTSTCTKAASVLESDAHLWTSRSRTQDSRETRTRLGTTDRARSYSNSSESTTGCTTTPRRTITSSSTTRTSTAPRLCRRRKRRRARC